MSFFEDHSQYFSDFGVTAAIGANSFSVIFDHEYFAVDIGEAGQEHRQPFFTCISSDLPQGAADGTVVTIGGTDYRIKNIRPDGTGISVVDLYE